MNFLRHSFVILFLFAFAVMLLPIASWAHPPGDPDEVDLGNGDWRSCEAPDGPGRFLNAEGNPFLWAIVSFSARRGCSAPSSPQARHGQTPTMSRDNRP
jgi:hypothetical protein